MLSIKRIMFPTDFSQCADTALSWGLLLAKNFEAELYMFHAVVLHNDDVGEDVYTHFPDMDRCVKTLVENADSRLEKTIEDSGKLVVHQHVRRGFSKIDEILDFAEEKKIDLIVMGTHGRRGISHMVLGSVTEKVVRASTCPILTIRGAKDESVKADINRIVLPIDFSDHCKLAARYAIVMSKILGAKLDVIHVVNTDIHPAFYSAGIESATDLDGELMGRIEEMLKKFMGDCGATIDYSVKVVEGRPGKEIAGFADQEENSLIIIASHGIGKFERMMLGSTTERVIRMADSPVLTVKIDERGFVE